MSITSDEINYLIYRYMQESGEHLRPSLIRPPRTHLRMFASPYVSIIIIIVIPFSQLPAPSAAKALVSSGFSHSAFTFGCESQVIKVHLQSYAKFGLRGFDIDADSGRSLDRWLRTSQIVAGEHQRHKSAAGLSRLVRPERAAVR